MPLGVCTHLLLVSLLILMTDNLASASDALQAAGQRQQAINKLLREKQAELEQLHKARAPDPAIY